MRVLLVEDHPVYRDGLTALLDAADIEVVGAAATGEDALAMLDTEPDVVLMDIGLPDCDGAALTARLLERRPDVRVVVLTMFQDDSVIARALEAGARGYLIKDALPDEILAAVMAVANGSLVIGGDVASHARRLTMAESLRGGAPPATAFPELREREREVLGLVAQGMSNAAIAERLGLSGKTVANYVSTILARLQIDHRDGAAHVVQERTGRLSSGRARGRPRPGGTGRTTRRH